MRRFPSLTGEEVIRVLERAGFEVIRRRGSHMVMGHADGRQTVVPIHRGEDIGRGILSKILRDVDLDREQFLRLREEG